MPHDPERMPSPRNTPTIDEVRRFWTDSPLFVGEGRHEPGTRAWFDEHEDVYVNDCFAGEAHPIFTRGVTAETRLLDAGCGPGIWVRFFARRHLRHLSGCDLTPTAVALTKKSLEIFGLSADVEIGNIEALPYADGCFDHVNCQGVIHHTTNPAAAVREFHRVLAHDGTLCISVYHRSFLLRSPRLLRVLRRLLHSVISLKGRGRESMLATADADEIVRMYDGRDNPIGLSFTLDEFRDLVTTHFTVEEVGYFYFPGRVLPFKLPRALHRWLSRHHGLMVILRCRRKSGDEAK